LTSVREEKRGISATVGGTLPIPELLPSAHVHVSKSLDSAACQSQPTIRNISEENRQSEIAVIDEHSFTRECITKSLKERCSLLDIAAFAACDDCLRSARIYDVILYHPHQSITRRTNNQPVINIKKLLEIAPVIVLCDVDCVESILAVFESGARGYIPTTSTAVEIAVEIIHLVKAGGTFVPPSILCALDLGEGVALGATRSRQFTLRQLAVLEHLKLGKTNKIIAHELKISESTVKVHIRNIMKRLKATNRTEVVSRAHELGLGENHGTD
jgi:DNA-binding NarL/FixJ family response regulator